MVGVLATGAAWAQTQRQENNIPPAADVAVPQSAGSKTRIEFYNPNRRLTPAAEPGADYIPQGVVGVGRPVAGAEVNRAPAENLANADNEKYYVQVLMLVCLPPEEAAALDTSTLLTHEACGTDKAKALLQRKVWLPMQQSVNIQENQPVTRPKSRAEIPFFADKGFVLQHVMDAVSEEETARLTLHILSRDDVSLEIALKAHVVDFVTTEDVVRHNEDKTYLNPRLIPQEWFMVDKVRLNIGRTTIASGDVWLETPRRNLALGPFPPNKRLWVVLDLLPPPTTE